MTIELRSERLEISPIDRADIPLLVEYRQQPAVAVYQSWGPEFDAADAEALVAGQPVAGLPLPGGWVQLGLRPVRDGESAGALVGDVAIGMDPDQPDTYELGVTVAPRHQGAGYATEALTAVIDWLMRDQGAHRIVMQGDARNTAVIALMQRLGLRREGAIVDGDWFKGEWTTLERYAVLRREWLER